MDDWIRENIQTIMMVIGGASMVGVVVIFAAYMAVKRNIRKDKDS